MMDTTSFARLLADEDMFALVFEALDTYRSLMRANEDTAVSIAESEYFSSVIANLGELLRALEAE